MARYFLEFSVKKSRTLLLLGALAVAAALSGCMATMIQTGKDWTNRLTGANDPNNKGVLAEAGRLQNAGTDLTARAVGIETTPPSAEVTPPPVLAAPVAAQKPAASYTKKPPPAAKKPSPSPIQPVAATAADKPVKPATAVPKKPAEDKKPG